MTYYLVNLADGTVSIHETYSDAVEEIEKRTADGFFTPWDFAIYDEDEYAKYCDEVYQETEKFRLFFCRRIRLLRRLNFVG